MAARALIAPVTGLWRQWTDLSLVWCAEHCPNQSCHYS